MQWILAAFARFCLARVFLDQFGVRIPFRSQGENSILGANESSWKVIVCYLHRHQYK